MNKNEMAIRGRSILVESLTNLGIKFDYKSSSKSRGPIYYETSNGKQAPAYVRTKQGNVWPRCKGLADEHDILVLIDFSDLKSSQAVYILNKSDWLRVVARRIREILESRPQKKIIMNEENTPVFVDEISPNGKSFEGIDLAPDHVKEYRDAWHSFR
jgi:hypothetical protein